MGVRYTAEKFMVGKYLSTPIYKFKMKCHMCPQMLEMRTDPKNFEYLCVSGSYQNQHIIFAQFEHFLIPKKAAEET